MKRLLVLSITLLVLTACSPLENIPYRPEQTPESWLKIQPYVNIKAGSLEFILVQPTSTVFVYLLGIIAILIGLYFLRIREQYQSRKWWGIALLLWGVGALLAGTSYQAFSYEIKCAGRGLCSWTSWWEIIYLLLSAASIDAFLVSEAYASMSRKYRPWLIGYAIVNFTLYALLVLIGVFIPNKFLISFEFLLLVTAPSILFLLILNAWRYVKYRERLDLLLVVNWLWLGIIIGAYFIALVLEMTDYFWSRGLWFSENDVLHLGLISWMIYMAVVVAKRLSDRP